MKKIAPIITLLFILISIISFLNLRKQSVPNSQRKLEQSETQRKPDTRTSVNLDDEREIIESRQIREENELRKYIWKSQKTYPELMNLCKRYEGYELIDIEIENIGQDVYYDFILHHTSSTQSIFKRCNIVKDTTPREMRERLRNSNLRIVDLEVRTPINDPKLYAIVKESIEKYGYEFRINNSASQVLEFKNNNPNLRFIDIEFNNQNNANNYHFVTIPNKNELEWELHLSQNKTSFNTLLSDTGYRPIDIEHGSNNNIITAVSIKDSSYWAYRTEIPEETINQQIKTRDMKIIDLERNSDGSYSLVMTNNIADRLHPKHEAAVAYIQNVIDAGAVGVTVSIVKDKEIIYSIGSGFSDLSMNYPMSPYVTTQRWASLSKAAGGALAALFDQMRFIDIQNDPISKYTNYPLYDNAETSRPSRIPTFAQLFSHEGGIQHYVGSLDMVPPLSDINSTSNRSMKWAVDYWVNQMPYLPRLGTYTYSTFGPNLGCVGLEEAYRKATGKSTLIPTLFKQLLLNPIGVNKITPDYYNSNDPNKTKAYLLDGTIDPDGENDVSYKLCGGGFKSTNLNLAKYLSLFWGGSRTPLNIRSRNKIFTDYTSDNSGYSYGLGWVIRTRNRASHTGSQPGARNEVWLKYDEGNAVVIMSNTKDDSSFVVSQLINDLITLFELD
jgi:CubicO group peptidase (beta-lactamase class C family)